MIGIKQKKLVLSSCLAMCLLLACRGAELKTKSNSYGQDWPLGKKLFYDYCSACHVPRIKDQVFESFNSSDRGATEKDRLDHFQSVLKDDNHSKKNIGHELLSIGELREVLIYIESPQKQITIN